MNVKSWPGFGPHGTVGADLLPDGRRMAGG
jgi:hypothetical protein